MVSGARTPVNNASRGRFGEASAQFALEDLAGGVAWQVLHEEDVLGALEVRQLPSGVFFELFAQVLSIGVFPEYHHGAYGLDSCISNLLVASRLARGQAYRPVEPYDLAI
jgi:hypothetical protein